MTALDRLLVQRRWLVGGVAALVVIVLVAGIAGAITVEDDDGGGGDSGTIAASGAVTSTAPPAPGVRPPSPVAGSIVFISNRGSPPPRPTTGPVVPSSGGYNVWIMAPDGTNQRPLTDTDSDAEPDLSSDGNRVVWVKNNNEVWTMNSDGTSKARLGRCRQACGFPRWSPDGRRVAFTDQGIRTGEVVVIDADGDDRRRYQTRVNPYRVDWSPDGSKLAISVSGSPTEAGIAIFDLISGSERRVRTGNSLGAAWSPDGRLILFSDMLQLYTMAPDGSGVRQLTSGTGQRLGGAWSSDGRTIVFDYFAGRTGTLQQIWTMTSEGTGGRPLTQGPGDCYEATF